MGRTNGLCKTGSDRIFTQRFYQELVAGKTMGAATRLARQSLATNPFRLTNGEDKRTLQDWFRSHIHPTVLSRIGRGQDDGAGNPPRASISCHQSLSPDQWGGQTDSARLVQIAYSPNGFIKNWSRARRWGRQPASRVNLLPPIPFA